MDNNNEKIQLDDITFDDVIAGDGVATEEITPEVADETSIEVPESKELEIDGIEEKEEEQEEEEVEDDTEQMDEVLGNFPLVKNHLEYVLNGGDSQKFMQAYDPNQDYNQMTIEEDDVRSQKALLQDYFAVKGHDKEFIDEMIQDYSDNGKLFNKSEAARSALGKVQAQQKENLVKEQKEMGRMQQQEQKDFWDGVATTIKDSNEFAGLTVPQREKSKFFDYLSKPVNKEGYTQRDIDHSEAEMDKKLAIDYLMFKGFNLDQIINTKARTKNTKSLRDKISRNTETAKNARRSGRKAKNFDIDDLDLSI